MSGKPTRFLYKTAEAPVASNNTNVQLHLKVHKIENFFGSEFEFFTISLLVMLKY